MKQMILGGCCLLLVVYAVYINANFTGMASREVEISMALSHGISQTLEAHKSERFSSEGDMEKYFYKVFQAQVMSDGKLEIHVITSNCQYGLLDVEVTQYFQTSDQKERKITVRKCGIIEE